MVGGHVVTRRVALWACAAMLGISCDRAPSPPSAAAVPDEPSPVFRNVATTTAYVGDVACAGCHVREDSVYQRHAMAQSFHRWTAATRVETPLDTPLVNAPTGLMYAVVDSGGWLYQVEFIAGPDGKRLHELRRRIDYVMGSGHVARTYFTEENGRYFQLPLTWYRTHGWDFSPGYELSNPRFDRVLPDRCVACHASYPVPQPHLEGKFAELRNGIGCERCHGPGALHVSERSRAPRAVRGDTTFDNAIVNPARLPLERRLDTCEQCHVHTATSVLREGKTAYSFVPSQPLRDTYAFFRVAGSIDVVSHADRLRQSACFLATRQAVRPLECATCHNPHLPHADSLSRSRPCQACHAAARLAERLARSSSLAAHGPGADCVSCHMPRIKESGVPHGTFTEHWIRVAATQERPAGRADPGQPIEPYYERDRAGPEAALYQGLGKIVYATLGNDGRVLRNAIPELDKALGADTTHGEAHFLLGVAYQQIGKSAEAVRALERSVRTDSNRPERLRALALAYAGAGRPPQAIDLLYRRALTLQPALAWIRADYADFLQGQGRRADAKVEYQRAVAEQPSLAVAWFNLGTLLAEEQRRDESSAAFQQAVHLDPMLAQALSPLLQITTRAQAVKGVSSLGSPLASLPVRERGPGAAQLTIASAGAGLEFINVLPRGFVVIMKPDGTLVRALATGEYTAVAWDLKDSAGVPIAGGLYRVRVQGRNTSGEPQALQTFSFGVVRVRGT